MSTLPARFLGSDFLASAPTRLMSGTAAGGGMHRVYNFEVAHHHTYIAGGVRVHNTSVLSFLTNSDIQNADWSSLADLNGDGRFDYIEVDAIVNGLPAGSTIYRMESAGGVNYARGFRTFTDEQGRLIQIQFVKDENGVIRENAIELTGAEFGERAGQFLTPFITAAILGEDAGVFERLVADTIIGTFVQNVFEFAGGFIHDQLVSGGLQNNSFDAIAAHTFHDFGHDLIGNAVNNAQSQLSQWIMAEVFEGLNTDTFGGKFASLLAQQGIDYILDLSVHTIAQDVLGLSQAQINDLGFTAPQLNQLFSGPNLLNLVFKAAIGTILPSLESTEAQIGSGLITIGLQVFAGVTGVLGTVLGYVGGLILDLIFDTDPQAFTNVVYSPLSGGLVVNATTSADGGTSALARAAADTYVDFVNGLIDRAQSQSNNLDQLATTMNLVFGHYEQNYRNGDGKNYKTMEAAVVSRIIDTLRNLDMNDGDVKFAAAIAHIVSRGTTVPAGELLNEFSMRAQVASDYDAYLQNKAAYDALIAADPESAFAQGWAVTFALAREYGYAQNFTVNGDATDGTHIASSGNDVINAYGGNDSLVGHSGNDRLNGGTGEDRIYGGTGNDTLNGNEDDDRIFGGGGTDTIYAGWGMDEIWAGEGQKTVAGGGNEDMITFGGRFADYTVVNHGGNVLTVTHKTNGSRYSISEVEFLRFKDVVRTYDPAYNTYVTGTNGDDLLYGTDLRDAIFGLAGDDVLYGFDGDDFLSGDAGDDTIYGGDGDDWIFGVSGNDVVYGGSGNDPLYGGAQGDLVIGEAGNDTLRGEAGDDVLDGGLGIDSLIGGDGDDLMTGGDGNDRFDGGLGDDDHYGGNGSDVIYGNGGDDFVDGGAQNDTIYGGWGDDEIDGGSENDTLYGEGSQDTIIGGAGDDSIFGGWGDDLVYGGDGNDKIFALANSNEASPFVWIEAEVANNGAALYNEWGAEIAYGGAGNDQIALNGGGGMAFGGSGNDVIYFDGFQSRLNGGTGTDRAQTQGTNFIDAIWYRAPDGQIGAIVWENESNNTHKSANHWSYFVGIEEIRTDNGKILTPGWSYNNGFGNAKYQNAQNVGFTNLTQAEFDAKFSESSYLATAVNVMRSANQAPIAGWNQFGTGNDVIVENTTYQFAGNQRIRGGAGNDTIEGGSGNDRLEGEAGTDTLFGGSGSDSLSGGDGNDSLNGNSGADLLYGGLGDESLVGDSGDDSLWGNAGLDRMYGGSGHDWMTGEADGDTAYGGSGRDTIFGGAGIDSLYGDDSRDVIDGGTETDYLSGGDGGDSISGGAGEDRIWGNTGLDELYGGTERDTLYGADGMDLLYGGLGDDRLQGGNAADNIYGDGGNDSLYGEAGNDALYGLDGNDTLWGNEGADRLDGGTGIDLATYSTAAAAVSVDLSRGIGLAGEALDDVYVSIENLGGSAHADLLIGDDASNNISAGDGNNSVEGRGGADSIYAGIGADRVDGGDGDDRVQTNDGADLILGGRGMDLIYAGLGHDIVDGGSGNDDIRGEGGDDDLKGGLGADRFYGGDGDDIVSGDEGDDRLYGEAHSDQLIGGTGNDSLYGGDHMDVLIGGDGADRLWGDTGDDMLSGGLGDDRLNGGTGTDVFLTGYGEGHDIIEDFLPGTDRIGFADGVYQITVYDDVGGARVVLSGDTTLFLTGVTASQMTAARFVAPSTGSLSIVAGQIGTAAAETLTGTSGNNVILALAGNDTVYGGGAGQDALWGEAGSDRLYGGSGRSGLYGGADSDTLYPGSGYEVLDGGSGTDTVNLSASAAAVEVDLGAGRGTGGLAEQDQFIGIEDLVGSALGDILTGSAGANKLWGGGGTDRISGLDGNDQLFGEAGDDSLSGGLGDDTLEGGAGADRIAGNEGNDMLRYTTSTAGVTIDLAARTASGGDAQGDVILSIENLTGSNLADRLTGSTAANTFYGANGSDTLTGGKGNDLLFGGSGGDVFQFVRGDGADRIADYADGSDKIRLAGLSWAAVTVTTSGVDAVINYGSGSTITLTGIAAAAIGADDFLFA